MATDANPKGTGDTLWTANDVATFFKASRSWVYRQSELGLLPHFRIGGLLRFDPAKMRRIARGEADPRGRIVRLPRPT